MSLLMADGHPEALEAALCAVYAPRDPIGEYWQGQITLRALYTLIRHMPPDNAFAREYGHGWDETQWLTADMCAMLRDLQRTLISCTPTDNDIDLDRIVRPMPQPPAERVTRGERQAHVINTAERDSLMAIATGHTD